MLTPLDKPACFQIPQSKSAIQPTTPNPLPALSMSHMQFNNPTLIDILQSDLSSLETPTIFPDYLPKHASQPHFTPLPPSHAVSSPILGDPPHPQIDASHPCFPIFSSDELTPQFGFEFDCQLEKDRGVGVFQLEHHRQLPVNHSPQMQTQQYSLTSSSMNRTSLTNSALAHDSFGPYPPFSVYTNNLAPNHDETSAVFLRNEPSDCTSFHQQGVSHLPSSCDTPMLSLPDLQHESVQQEDVVSCTVLQQGEDSSADDDKSGETDMGTLRDQPAKTTKLLSPIDKKELRAQRNRESARRSRIKTKKHYEEMERKYEHVSSENANLRTLVETLLPKCMERNSDLRNKIRQLIPQN